MFFCYAHRQTLAVAAPFMMNDLKLNRAAIGLLLSVFFWSYSLAQVPAGWLIDRYGVGRVYAIGFVIWTTAVALTSLSSTLGGLIAAQLLLGVGQGVPFPASARAVTNAFPAGERGTATGLYLSGNRVGQALVGAIGPAIVLTHGWHAFFLIAGLAGFIWLAPWLLWCRIWDEGAGPGTRKREGALSLRQSVTLLRDRRIAGIFLGFFAYDYVWFLLLRWTPVYLSVERNFSPREIALASSVPYLAVAFLIIPAGSIGDVLIRKGYSEITARKTLISGGMLVAVLIVPAALVRHNAAAAWFLAGATCGLGVAAPNAWLLTQAICPKQVVGTASGIQNFGGNLAGIVAPALTGFLAQKAGASTWAFCFAGLILLCGIGCYWLLIPEQMPDMVGQADQYTGR
jgi:MFS transporter, ACS family, D-galactonate transporter